MDGVPVVSNVHEDSPIKPKIASVLRPHAANCFTIAFFTGASSGGARRRETAYFPRVAGGRTWPALRFSR